ncbi:hypothetical protein AGMMS49950_02440 [Endomicrobiia bacterium]|nr:hypothetical protein AGMMS49950_02440 [Endomicrobiia bacterium]
MIDGEVGVREGFDEVEAAVVVEDVVSREIFDEVAAVVVGEVGVRDGFDEVVAVVGRSTGSSTTRA